MDSIWSFMDIIFVGAGVYMLYGWYLMKTTGEIKTALLLNKNIELRKCKDLEGYKHFVAPKMVIFAAAAILYGGFGLVNAYVYPMPTVVYFLVMILFFAVLVWYAVQTRKGVQLYW